MFASRPAGCLSRHYHLLADAFCVLAPHVVGPSALRSFFTIKTKPPPSLEKFYRKTMLLAAASDPAGNFFSALTCNEFSARQVIYTELAKKLLGQHINSCSRVVHKWRSALYFQWFQ
jgi:hypothetical protein